YPPGSMLLTSWSQVCGFIATMRSTPPRRPRYPASDTRTSNQVGRPWMFDGKILRDATGTPMRRIDRANSWLALAEPDPLTLANLTTKSLIAVIGFDIPRPPVSSREGTSACPRLRSGNARRRARNEGTCLRLWP